jgi:hypothetical protein
LGFENIWPQRDEVTGNGENFIMGSFMICLHTIVRVIKLRKMRWARHIVCMGEGKDMYRVLVGNLRERDHWGDPGIGGRVILRWKFRKWDVGGRD